MAIFLPIIIGAALSVAGAAIKSGEERDANNKRNALFEELRQSQNKFETEQDKNLRDQIDQFGSEERHEKEEAFIREDTEALGATLAKDRTALTEPVVGNVSERFINQRAGVNDEVFGDALRKAGLLARVRGPGQLNFSEREAGVEGSGRANTIRGLQLGDLSAREDRVNAVQQKNSFLGDFFSAVGPLIATSGFATSL